jgi:putative salt-induced outer membrane protein YdiY
MYDDKLEFDSDEIGLYTFKFDDISQIKSYNLIEINIQGVANISGIIRYKNEKMLIIQGKDTYTFDKEQIVSLAHSGEQEIHYWSGKVTLSIDIRSGNKNQFDYSAKAGIKRRTATTRLALDYLGRVTSTNDIETANAHRINEKYDIYLTRYFFWTPLFSEYYQDKFQNIDNQYTFGVGIGYTMIHTADTEWDISGGPAVMHTKYSTVAVDENLKRTSFAVELSTRFEYELSNITDIIYQYKLTFTDKDSGRYKHHMVLTLENEILDWLDFDIGGVWDYTAEPELSSTGIKPLQSDYQLLAGFGIEF